MLLQPFIGAILVYRNAEWALLPALVAVVATFLVRQPLVILSRQRWVWRTPHPETAEATRNLMVESGLLAMAGLALAVWWPLPLLAALAVSAGLLTALAVYVTIQGKQRAVWFQAVSAAELASSCLAVCLSTERAIPQWAWWFWGLHTAHYLAAILVVHARLDAMVAERRRKPRPTPAAAIWMTAAFAIAGMGLIFARFTYYGAALLLSSLAHMGNLRGITTGQSLGVPLRRVGVRAMVVSIMITLLLVAGAIRPRPIFVGIFAGIVKSAVGSLTLSPPVRQ